MNDFNRDYARSIPADRADMSVDAGLRSFMLGVYNKVALGLLLSAGLAFLTSGYVPSIANVLYELTPDGRLLGFTLMGMVLRFAPLVMIVASMFIKPTARTSGILYWALVASIGAGLGLWLIVYNVQSVFATFLVTAIAFGGLSLVGYTTKKDLSGFGSFLIMGLIGLVVASLVQAFLHLPGLGFIINILGVLIFAGLIAYDTQNLKMTYYQLGGDRESTAVATNYGALNLYLNFINLFRFLLSFMGSRR